MAEAQAQEDLASLLEGLEIDGLMDLEKFQGGAPVTEEVEGEEEDFEYQDDRSGFPKTVSAPPCLTNYTPDPWAQTALSGLLSAPTAPMESLPRLASMPSTLHAGAPLTGNLPACLTAEDLEKDLVMGINLNTTAVALPVDPVAEALMMNPFMQNLNVMGMMGQEPPFGLTRDPLALPDEDMDAAGGKKRRRRRRRPKKDRRDDPAYWETRPPAEQCMIIPIMEQADSPQQSSMDTGLPISMSVAQMAVA
eukprot:TRINITY_DN30637_c0_g1_i1.p1 TRINITY_DN30637_c0_g1~~TRINITY_DN30637_c0_g1_i1.p1  ORF type:complete len:266 (+),score=57.79 TRINITY_DN30637_c0_g1_i1:51-800(+)